MAVDAREDLDPGAVLLDPRRADEHRADRVALEVGEASSSSKECTWRPNALRRRRCPSIPRCSRSSMMSPAHVPNIGVPDARARAAGRRGPRARSRASSSSTRRRQDEPVEPVEIRGDADLADVGAQRRAGRARARRTRPGGRAPRRRRQDYQPRLASSLLGLELARLEHSSRCQALRGARDAVGVGEVRRGLDDRRRAGRRVLGLEDARSRRRRPARRAASSSDASAGVAMPPAQKSGTGSWPSRGRRRTRS